MSEHKRSRAVTLGSALLVFALMTAPGVWYFAGSFGCYVFAALCAISATLAVLVIKGD